MSNNIKKVFPFLLLSLLFVVFLIISFKSEGYYGGADNLVHYLYSKLAFKYSHLFLHHWGKPFYILLSSSFAQFGFNGIKVFNIVVGLLTALFSFLIVKELKYKNAWLIIIFTSFAPIYFVMHFTALTEMLFSFILVLTVYYILKNKYILSAIVLSFLVLTRTEGIVIIPIFWTLYLFKRKYLSIVFTFCAFIIYSFIGYFYYHDIFWLITQMPYTGASDIYGNGDLFHFINSSKFIWGIPLSILFLVGVVVLVFQLIKKPFKQSIILVLIFLIVISYFSAHSVAWWLGKGGSLGLIRVMTGVVPLFAIISLLGFNFFDKILSSYLIPKYIFQAAIIYFIIRTALAIFPIPIQLNDNERLVKTASEWFKESEYKNNRIFYYDPHFWFFCDLDVYNKKTNKWMLFQDYPGIDQMSENNLIFWDAHFGPNDGRLAVEKLLEDEKFKLIKTFEPKVNFQVLGGHDYKIYVFQRKPL